MFVETESGQETADGIISAFAAEDKQTRDLVKDLHRPRPLVYWSDLILTSVTGWSAFALVVYARGFSPLMLLAAAIAAAALYRGLCFVHEISHHGGRVLPGFETGWNLLIGYPLLMPSFVYADVHQSHHKLSTYGTIADPEYMPFASNSIMTTIFALESPLIPVALVIRFLILSLAGFVFPAFQRWLVVFFSSLTMNLKYRRTATPELIAEVRRGSALVLLVWLGFAALAALHILWWRFFVLWLGVSAAISFVNTLRTLGAHAYESEGQPMDREGQLRDSIDTPGAVWTELWAPVGLRYHALHHYFPGIPYHNLPRAWTRIAATLPEDAVFHAAQSRGLVWSLGALLKKGSQRLRGRTV